MKRELTEFEKAVLDAFGSIELLESAVNKEDKLFSLLIDNVEKENK